MLNSQLNDFASAAHLTQVASYFDIVDNAVKTGDIIEIGFGTKTVKVEVLDVQETVKKDDAKELYRYL